MLATIRNRRGLIATVEPFPSQDGGLLHLVRVEYTDSDGVAEDTVLWEREHGRDLLEPNALPQVQAEASMEPREFDALVRAARWAALTPFLHPDGSGRAPDAPIVFGTECRPAGVPGLSGVRAEPVPARVASGSSGIRAGAPASLRQAGGARWVLCGRHL